jgi:outer membrane immunogenic protein
MRLAALTTASLIALSAASGACAADLRGTLKPLPYAPAPVPAFTWAGAYVGLHAGYALGADSEATTTGTPGFLGLIGPGIAPGQLKVGRDGFMGGGQVGYNAQFGNLVTGLEADLSLMPKGRDSGFIGATALGTTQLLTSASSEMRWFGTVRARLGVANDRVLVYATGGLAFADLKTSASVTGVQAPGLVWSDAKSETKFGWTLGAGLEYAVTQNWTVKGEYLYYDLGKSDLLATGNAAVRAIPALNGVDYGTSIAAKGSIMRTGVNYKF